MRRLYSIGIPKSTSGKRFGRNPGKGFNRNQPGGEFDGQRLVQEIPPVGTVYTLLWYTSYHGKVQTIPN